MFNKKNTILDYGYGCGGRYDARWCYLYRQIWEKALKMRTTMLI